MRHCALAFLLLAAGNDAPLPDKVEFNRDIRPILSDTCFTCHGPDGRTREAKLRVDTHKGALLGGEGGEPALVPGKAEKSGIYLRLITKDRDERMPPAKTGKKLTPRDIALVKKWIEQGGEYQGHWAFVPPVRTPGSIDQLLRARLQKEGLKPAPEADRVTLARRLHLDLTGLPPEPADVDRFAADRDPKAYENLVDRLLASPHYGERMALYWLDLVRYGDSRGYHSDNPRNVGPYRDYVIQAFNENLPFDRFTREQIAGDLIPGATLRQRVASGYNKLNLTTEEGGAQAKEYEAKTAGDRVRNIGAVWMGATLGCAECHDHKFDPYTQRDFYSLAAFFADIQEGAIGDGDKGILVPRPEESKRLEEFDLALAALKQRLETQTPELDAAQIEWEKTALEPAPWTVLTLEQLKSAGGAELKASEDGSILVTGKSPAKDTHSAVVAVDAAGITAFRLEALAWGEKKGPGRSGNGNFVLTQFGVKQGAKAVTLHKASADHSQDNFPIASALDAKKQTGWAVLPQTGVDHAAVFEVKEFPAGEAGKPLTFTLDYQSPHAEHVIGRFRISATKSKNPGSIVPAKVRAALAAEPRTDAHKKDLAAHYRTLAPLLDPVRAELAATTKKREEFEKTIRRSLVSMQGAPRTLRILNRGNWMDDKGEVVLPATPEFLGVPPKSERRLTRLDLANWLVSKENPLTARTFANRMWMLFYGTGISRRLEDIGGQGEWPVHPELLDVLALEFAETWDVKRFVKLLVTTETYRQSSVQSREAREKDPFNRLLAFQSRWRLDAEVIRDNALAVSGLLVRRIGGDSVRPYQPAGYWTHLNFPKREWTADRDDNVWRRGIYTWWQRSFLHPSLQAFDAPNREEGCAERPRSNIPQQALALLNDPTFVEAARVFGARIVKEGGSTAQDRIAWAFRRALSRAPRAEELRILSELQAGQHALALKDPKAAELILKVGQSPAPQGDVAELASWTAVARAILNLHETITRF